MSDKSKIEKQIIHDVELSLADIDIDGMIKQYTSSKAVNEAVKRYCQDKIAEIIQEKAYLKIKKVMPIIDAWTENKVRGFLIELGVK